MNIKSISKFLLFLSLISIVIIVLSSLVLFSIQPDNFYLNIFYASIFLFCFLLIGRYFLLKQLNSEINNFIENISSINNNNEKTFNRIHIDEFKELQKKLDLFYKKHKDNLKEKNELLAVLYSMDEAVVAIDLDGNIIMLNPSGAKLFNIDFKSSIGKSIFDIIRNSNLITFFEQITNENTFHKSIIHLSNRDIYLNAIGSGLLNSNNDVVGAVIVMNDITQLRKLENIRKEFVSNVSHELKTPITAIMGFVETLKNIDNNNEDQKKFLQIIESHSDRLNSIIDDLLNLSRIEEQGGNEKLNLKNQKLLPVIDQAIQDCDILIRDKNISVKINCDKQISILQNSRLMQEALGNLISNAIKYSDNESEIIISVNQSNDENIIAVKDYGIGISEKHQERLFERFYRVDESRSRDQGGTGLGLSIVKHIVNFHNGKITIDSELGSGSTFNIIIPQ